MSDVNIQIYLSMDMLNMDNWPMTNKNEEPIEDIESLKKLYQYKYGSFGTVRFYVYDEEGEEAFIEGINTLFNQQGIETMVDATLLEANMTKLVPMIVVNDEIVSQGIYPDLTLLRGGSNSVARGGSGAHGDH